MNTLSLSYDRKVSPSSALHKKGYVPRIGNAFGLPAGTAGSCPGATLACEGVCYAARTENTYKAAGALVRRNFEALQACNGHVPATADLLDTLVADFLAEHRKVEARTGHTMAPVFRIHWDGDFFSVAYAEAWRRIILANPDVQFWAYTRSFLPNVNVIPTLHGLGNLALYISVDKFNEEWAKVILSLYPQVQAAVLDTTFEEGQERVQFLTGRKAPKCPENARKVPLVNDEGEGACVTCGLCVFGRAPVLFSTTKK